MDVTLAEFMMIVTYAINLPFGKVIPHFVERPATANSTWG
jgi:hypothetical protein